MNNQSTKPFGSLSGSTYPNQILTSNIQLQQGPSARTNPDPQNIRSGVNANVPPPTEAIDKYAFGDGIARPFEAKPEWIDPSGKPNIDKIKQTPYKPPDNAPIYKMQKLKRIAQIHGNASKIGITPDIKPQNVRDINLQHRLEQVSQKNLAYCSYCKSYEVRDDDPDQHFSLFVDPIELDFLGSGYPLYFDFVKYIAIMFTLLILTTGAYNFLSNGYGKYCHSGVVSASAQNTTSASAAVNDIVCPKQFWTQQSFVNKINNKDLVQMQYILNLFSIATIIVFFQFFRVRQSHVEKQCDQSEITASDYAVFVSNIPQEPTDRANTDFDLNSKIAGSQNKELTLVDRFEKYVRLYVERGVDPSEIPGTTTGYENPQYDLQGGFERKVANVNCCFNLKAYSEAKAELEKALNLYSKCLEIKFKTKTWPTHLTWFQRLFVSGADENGNVAAQEDQLKIISTWRLIIKKICKGEIQIQQRPGHLQYPFTGYAFVTFDYESVKNKVLEFSNFTWIHRLFRGSEKVKPILFVNKDKKVVKAKVTEAPEPTDVFWQNMHYTQTERYIRQFIAALIIFVLLFGCFFLIFALAVEQQNYNQQLLAIQQAKNGSTQQPKLFGDAYGASGDDNSHQYDHQHALHADAAASTASSQAQSSYSLAKVTDEAKIKAIALSISITIIVLNKVLTYAMVYITDFEKHTTKTGYMVALAAGTTLALFFNTGLQTFAIKVLVPWYSESLLSAQKQILEASGLVINQNFVLIQNALLTPILTAIDFPYLYKLWQRRGFALESKDFPYYQKQLNAIMENPEFEIAQKYSFIMNTLLLTAFYAPLIPMAIIYGLVAVFFAYWIDKFELLYRRSAPTSYGLNLSLKMIELAEAFIPIYCFSNVLFDYILIQTDQSTLSQTLTIAELWRVIISANAYLLIGLIVGLVHMFVPVAEIHKLWNSFEKKDETNIDYQTAKNAYFRDRTYDSQNPVTKSIQ